ncbi:MAG: hybrid sensor histidine kinase/response regulator [Acidobacteria bacterium]|nr:hybrid sensor histidine kinase/response regulator [Acidobacteriota bacterium]
MAERDDEFLTRLLATFKGEAEDHLRAMSSGLLELEKSRTADKQREIVERVFREAHSLKGAARAVNLSEVEALCQSLENAFSALKRESLVLSPPVFDALHLAMDTVSDFVGVAGTERAGELQSRIVQALQGIENALKSTPSVSPRESTKPPPGQSPRTARPESGQSLEEDAVLRPVQEPRGAPEDTVRISTAKVNALLLQAEELLSARLAATQRAKELREVAQSLTAWEKQRSKQQPQVSAVQKWLDGMAKRDGTDAGLQDGQRLSAVLGGLLRFFEWNDGAIKSLQGRLSALARSAEHDQRTLAGMVNALNQNAKKVLMLPFSSMLEGFPKLVRDISRDHGKEAALSIQGGGIEVDRRILEEMKGSLTHLVRNCTDHGIEDREERSRKGKPLAGTIVLAIAQRNGDKVEIRVSDDGAGIDLNKVQAAALKLGIVSQQDIDQMDAQGVTALVFHSGVSTSPMITDLSGRGLGLAIVREKVEKFGGNISVETAPDRGTTFRLVLPLTLATFRGVVVRSEGTCLVFPSTHVERAVRVRRGDIQTVENRETIRLNGDVVSLVRLSDALAVPRKGASGEPTEQVHAVLVRAMNKRIAFLVDEVLEEQEVLVRGLGRQLTRVRNFAGAAVLGNGKLVPVLNPSDLVKSAVKVAPSSALPVASGESPSGRRPILVAEDSITARSLLRNILESAGYDVQTAVDGVDALTALKAGEFGLVVSDVDMPRMNGFDLTARIRADKKLGELPVVLVTALESREDRECGLDVGANAYIVKSSFDQSNLLEIVRRLI